ncbi:MAG: polysaccharide biosynthesis C-terminal domain-containing protein [Bacteroidota bacterium]|nr:polysaccharide biosynthesis C-terminal domain-containing protein [Bacteroidota bacterium]
MGCGVNGQIIATSTYWRFDFFSGIILLILIVPLNIILVKNYGIIGSAWSTLLSYVVYNIIRIIFLQRKFNLQPFTINTAWVIAHGVICFTIVYYLFKNLEGWLGMGLRSIFFVLIFTVSAYYLRLSPDIRPVMETIKKKLRL